MWEWIWGSLEMPWLWKGETEAGVDGGNIQVWKNVGMREGSAPSGSCGGISAVGLEILGSSEEMGSE